MKLPSKLLVSPQSDSHDRFVYDRHNVNVNIFDIIQIVRTFRVELNNQTDALAFFRDMHNEANRCSASFGNLH